MSEEPDIYDAVAELRARTWSYDWPDVNGFYWLRGWRHYKDLPIKIEGDTFWAMFGTARYDKADLSDSRPQFQGPITPIEAS